ncbi:MAG: S8 family serine peptidase [Chloroflexi bacterium]|nr:S8 family serine peptidase [Chloroflexota bacterium]MCL5074333.1 S8 family serine peptidase [Chloroflexota bacterium]
MLRNIKRLPLFLLIAVLLFTLLPTNLTQVRAAALKEPPPGTFVPGRIIVKFNPQANQVAQTILGMMYGLSRQETIPAIGADIYTVTPGEEKQIAKALTAYTTVQYAEPDYTLHISRTPNDPLFASYQWNLRKIGAEAAWDINQGSSDITVAILDSGIDLGHPDLQAKIVPGYDFVNDDSNPSDDNGHGTHVAGIVAASTNNGVGIAGLSWGAKIMPIKVIDANGEGSTSNLEKGIIWAADHGAKIINMSLGGETSSPPSSLQEAINYAYQKGCLLVAAAGNNGSSTLFYPASLEHVISVAATDQNDARAYFSQYNAYVDVAAPGVGIASTFPCSMASYPYALGSGTSQAAPHVAGLAALVWSVNPNLSNDQVEQIIENTADDLGPSGRDDYYGAGRINAYRALIEAQKTASIIVQVDTPAPGSSVWRAASINISGWAIDQGSPSGTGINAIRLYLDGTACSGTLLGTASYGLPRPDVAAIYGPKFQNSGWSFTWDATTTTLGQHTLLICTDSSRLGLVSKTMDVIMATPFVKDLNRPYIYFPLIMRAYSGAW